MVEINERELSSRKSVRNQQKKDPQSFGIGKDNQQS